MISSEEAGALATAEWRHAAEQCSLMAEWEAAHPRDSYAEPWQRPEAERQFRAQHGIPDYDQPGRLYVSGGRQSSWWALKLKQPSPWGSHVIECRACGRLALVHHPMRGAGHCHDCRGPQLEQRAAVKAAKRIERRKERSAALASREGLCLVCRTPITVARVTRKTCSDRCRKQLLRNPERYPLPEVPATVPINGRPTPLAVAHQQIDKALTHYRWGLIVGGRRDEVAHDPHLQQLLQGLEQVERLETLARLRAEAPAIFLAEVSQQEGSREATAPPKRFRVGSLMAPNPPNGKRVMRPSRWGNPFRVGIEAATAAEAVALFRSHLEQHPDLVELGRRELRGFDLGCSCPLDQPCHADVWLELANAGHGRS